MTRNNKIIYTIGGYALWQAIRDLYCVLTGTVVEQPSWSSVSASAIIAGLAITYAIWVDHKGQHGDNR
jgi:hypothetical protein